MRGHLVQAGKKSLDLRLGPSFSKLVQALEQAKGLGKPTGPIKGKSVLTEVGSADGRLKGATDSTLGSTLKFGRNFFKHFCINQYFDNHQLCKCLYC